MSRPLWGHPVGHDDPACRRRFPPWRAPEPPTKVGGLRGPSFRIKRISPRASQERFPGGWRRHKLPIPRRCPRAPAHAFRCSSFSHRKRCAGLRREPCVSPRDPLETTKGGCGPPLETPVRRRTGVFFCGGTEDGGPAVMQGILVCGRRGLGWPGRSRSGVGCSPTVGAGLCPRPVFRG